MKQRGKFIVIEGVDGSGKATQVRLLEDFLKEKIGNDKLLVTAFPRYYSSEWGKLVGEFLSGKFGELKDVSPYLATLTYMLDQYTWSRDIGRKWIENGGWVLSDRYFTSNVHQIAKLKTRAKSDFRKWIWKMGWDELGLLKPDLVLFLDRSPVDSSKLNKTKNDRAYIKGKKRDIAERDFSHQLNSYREYLRTVKDNSGWWMSIPCVTTGDIGGDTILIQERIRKVIEKRLL
ncbi:MAG: thymidylate kinase [Candidatus Microgenomates bacterium]